MGAAAIPLLIASTVASAGIGAAQAIQQNRAIGKAKEANRNAAEVQKNQLVDAAAVERQKRERETAALRGRIAAISGETGIAQDAYSGLFQQANTDLALNLDILQRNLANEQARVDSGLQANLAELSARQVNPLFSFLQGGLGGAQTGLSIATMGNQLFPRTTTSGPRVMGPIP